MLFPRSATVAAACLASIQLGGTAPAQCEQLERQRLRPQLEVAFDYFGRSLSLDGHTLAVGSDEYQRAATPPGRVHVFRLVGETWVEEQLIRPMDPSIGDEFGIAISLQGNWLAVGALRDDVLPPWQGKVYVFQHDGSQWVERQKIVAAQGKGKHQFGRTLELSHQVLLIGSHGADPGAVSRAGAAFVFRHDGVQWSQEKRLTASDGAAGDEFGRSVALDRTWAVIGAPRADPAGVDSGALYVYEYNGTRWRSRAKLTGSASGAGDEFAWVVDVQDDLIVAGAPREDASGADSGAAYVFRRTATGWVEEARLVASDGQAGDEFGISIATARDSVLVGARRHDAIEVDAGAAYRFRFDGHRWVEVQKLTASDADEEDEFGFWCAMDASRTVVGAAQNDLDARDSGAAYVFEHLPLGLKLDSIRPTAGDPVTFRTCGGRRGAPGMIVLVDVDGTPWSQSVTTGLFDAEGALEFSATIPPGLTGSVFAFRAYGLSRTDGFQESNQVLLSVQ